MKYLRPIPGVPDRCEPDQPDILTAEQVRERLSPTHEHEQVFDSHERLREQRDAAQRERGRLLYAIAQITPIAEAEAADRWRSSNTKKLDDAEAKVAQAKAALEQIVEDYVGFGPAAAIARDALALLTE